MKTLTLNLPVSHEINDKLLIGFLAAKLFEEGILTLGQAADTAGYSKSEFMDMLSSFGVSLFNYDEQDLENDILNVCSN